jgi:Rho-binding antiterminator
MTDYIPVDCGLHSEYELAVMHRDRRRLSWRGSDSSVHTGTLTPVDMCTRDSEEFMVLRDTDGAVLEIRLDRILRCDPV